MKVAFIDTIHPILWERLSGNGFSCLDWTKKSREEIVSEISDIEGIVLRSRIKIDKVFLDAALSLQFIARSGAGMENIDLAYAREKGIHCFHSPEGNQQAVAEHALGMLLNLLNHLNRADREVRNGIWRREENRGGELQAKTIGIIGYGFMGSAFAKALSGIGCRVLAHDKYKSGFGTEKVEEISLEVLQQEADVISIHLPQNEETLAYINSGFIQKCAKPFYLINTSRGKQVKTTDLVNALESGKVLGAGLDVFEYESTSFENWNANQYPEWERLKQMDHVILSPHVAGWTTESYFKLSNVLADKILGHFTNK